MKTHLPVALRKALIAALFAVSAFVYNTAYAEVTPSGTSLEVTVGGNNQTYEHDGDIKVSPMDSASGYDGLKLHAGNGADDAPGNITIESAATTLYNPEILAEGDITIGVDSEGNVNEYQNLIIRGSGSSVIESGGDIVFNHRVDAAVGQDASSGNGTGTDMTYTGALSIIAEGDITFDSIGVQDTNVSTIRLAGGNTKNDKALMSAGGDITVKDAGSSELAWTRYSEVLAGGDIDVQLPYGNGMFSGKVDAEGKFSFIGANFTAMDPRDTVPSITAGTGISVYTSALNTVSSAELLAEEGDVELVSHGGGYSNYIYQAKVTASDGDVLIDSDKGRAYMISSEVISETGSVSMTGVKVDAAQSRFSAEENLTLAGTSNTGLADVTATAATINVGTDTGDTNISSESELGDENSSLTATDNIEIKGSRVNISDDTTIRSQDGSVSIGAYGEYAEDLSTLRPFGSVNIRESEVEAQEDISITGAAVIMTDASAVSGGENTIAGSVETSLKGADVDGGSLSIGASTGTTTLGSSTDAGAVTNQTTLDATGRIAVTGTTVSLTDVSVDSTGTDADGASVAIIGNEVTVSGENVTGAGSVSIGGTTSTEVNGVAISGAGISLGSETGTTTITNTDDKDTTLDAAGKIAVTGTTVSLTDISVDSTGTDADGVSVAITGNAVKVSGENVTGAGSVSIGGTTSTEVNGVAVSGAGISLGSETGTTTITNTDDKDTTLDAAGKIAVTGTTVSLTDISVDSTGTDADGASVAITGADVQVSGKNVTGTGSVTIAGTDSTVVNGVDVDGNTVEIGGANSGTSIVGGTVDGAAGVKVNGSSVHVNNNAEIKAKDGAVSLSAGAVNYVDSGTSITAESGGVSLSITSDNGYGNLVSGAVRDDNDDLVAVNTVQLTAKDGAVTMAGGVAGTNMVEYATLKASGTEGFITITSKDNIIGADAELLAERDVVIKSVGSDADATNGDYDGNQIYSSEITSEEGNVTITAVALNALGDAQVTAEKGNVNLAADSNVIHEDSQVTAGLGLSINSTGKDARDGNVIIDSELKATGGDVQITAGNINEMAGADVTASEGKVVLKGDSNILLDGNTVNAASGVSISSSGSDSKDGNQVSDSVIQTAAGDVALTSNEYNAVINSELNAEQGDVIIGDEGGSTETVTNGIVSVGGIKTTITAGQNVRISGENVIQGGNVGDVSIVAVQGNIALSDDNTIINAEIDAQGAEGDVAITTGTGEKATVIEDSAITGETVTIAGDTTDRSDANLAVVTGGATSIASGGEDNGVGLTLNNVFVYNTVKEASNIIAMEQGNISILNRVDVQNGTLTINNGAAGDGRIVVDAGNVLNVRTESGLEGRLMGAGDINKSGGDALLLDYDHTEFTGSIYANGALGGGDGSLVDDPAANAGSWIEINGPGLGAEASIVLKNTDLVISTDKTQIGTLDTTQDSDANEADTGKTLLTNGSYTTDDSSRRDFTLVGSVLEVNKGVVGDVVKATNLQLSDATLIKLDAVVDDAGQLSSDVINASGSVDVAAARGLNRVSPATAPSTARLYVEGQASLSGAAEGARTTIMTGTMVRDINEDVLYEVKKSANGTYQRTLQDRNMHLENSDEGVELVISKNYRSCSKDAASQRVSEVIADLSDNFHHSEGTLAASSNTLERLVDAFDYTRSEAAAQAGLKSLAGQAQVLPMLMLYDASRHHLNQLRRQMEMPLCKWSGKGAQNRNSNAWVTYTGAHDTLAGDGNLGDYTRSANGALMGIDTSVSCNWRLGMSLGYETSTGEINATEVDADTIFVDAYAAGVTGNFKHRASIGMGFTTFESARSVYVDAGYHSFSGKVNSETDAISLNMGYEISSDYRIDERSYLARYLAVNLAWHKVDDSKESGIAGLGTSTEYDKEWQADVALGVSYNRSFAAVPHQNSALFYANAAVHLELLNDQSSVTGRFGNAAWESRSMKRDTVYFELGAGVVVPLSPAWTATAGAAVELGSEHTSVSGNVGVRYSF